MIGLLVALQLSSWADLVPTVAKSVPRVEIQKGGTSGSCSGVIFLTDADGFDHLFTAAHCVSKQTDTERVDLTVDGRTAVVTHSNAILDLAVLRVRHKNGVPITLAPDMPPAGSQVAIVGYAFGVEEIVTQFGYVAQSYNRESKTTWINADIIFGDSGGAAVDTQGRLVGINSRIYFQGPAHVGAVVTVDQIRDYLDAYRAELKKSEDRRR
jgi:S1-C subfamily serine protease